MSIRRRVATLLEIMAVFVGGLLTGRAVANWLGLESSKEAIASLPSAGTPDLLRLAGEHLRNGIAAAALVPIPAELLQLAVDRSSHRSWLMRF